MPYIGNTVQNQGFAPAIDYFSGNGVTVTFTLSRPIASVAQIICAIDNVIQNPSSAFTVSGNSITFTSAPLAGTNNIWVEYTSLITTYAAISQDPSVIGDITASGGYLSTGDFGNSYIDGIVVDYVTGNARLTTGPVDGLTIYNGGTAARTAMAAWDTSGNLTNTGNIGVGVAPNVSKVTNYSAGYGYGQFNYGNTAEDGANPLLGSYNTAAVTTATYGWAFYDSNSTGNLVLYKRAGSTTGVKSLEINRSNGAVTTPLQPYFYAQSTVAGTTYSNAVLPYDAVIYNDGSCYNGSTQTFTASVAGRYLFTAVCLNYPGASSGGEIFFSLNGSGSYNPLYRFNNIQQQQSFTLSAILKLAVGDYVQVKGNVNFYGVSGHSAFTGMLLG